MDNNFYVSYLINNRDEIIFVNEGWSYFAVINNTFELSADSIVKRSLWDFISDSTTEYIYREILRLVRSAQSMQIKLRCDSPESRRLIELSISLQPDGDVLFNSRTIWTEARPSQSILTRDVPRNADLLIICSWCEKVNTGKENWQEVEEAVKTLDLFEVESLPQISHGMCGDCYQTMSLKLKKFKTAQN
jgi:hypothetical protein